MKVLVTGATGFIGTPLVEELIAAGHEVLVLSRHPEAARAHFGGRVQALEIDKERGLITAAEFAEVEGIINLMGENISSGRWSKERKRRIKNSRVLGTKALVESVKNVPAHPLQVFINASAVGIYPVNTGLALSEDSALGNGFLAEVCSAWESEAQQISEVSENIRLCIARFGVVFGPRGGALEKMLPPFKVGLGGKMGSGKQVMSWIHRTDLIHLLQSALKDSNFKGIFNATSPHPISNEEFTKALGEVLRRPTFFCVPEVALKLLLGEMSSVILDSQDVRPTHLEQIGFEFKYPEIKGALTASVL